MIFRAGLLASTTLLSLAVLVPNQAYAGLLGAGNTVQAFYYNSQSASPESLFQCQMSLTGRFVSNAR